jgi:nitronate monooxygenase
MATVAGKIQLESDDALISTRLTESLGIKHPIVCAPMALVTGGALATAVSSAGLLGIVGGGYAGTLGGEPDQETELGQAESSRCGIGFITWALERVPRCSRRHCGTRGFVYSSLFGDPRPFAGEIRDSGAALMCQVRVLSQIDVALKAGATAIVVQGSEAGGHGASRSTLAFVPKAADYLKQRSPETLLLAAGGIADGRGVGSSPDAGCRWRGSGRGFGRRPKRSHQCRTRTRPSARPVTGPCGRRCWMRCGVSLGQRNTHSGS